MTRSTNTLAAELTYPHWWIVVVIAACSGTAELGSATGESGAGGGSGMHAQSGSGAAAMRQAAPAGMMSTSGSAAVTAGRAATPTVPAAPPNAAGASGTTGAAATAGMAAAGTTAAGMTAGVGGATAVTPMDIPCDPADRTEEATSVEFAQPREGQPTEMPTGPYEPVMESDPGIPTHTVVRPEPLGEIKHPILAWGQGGCRKNGNEAQNTNLFKEFASHGFVIIADGPARTGGPTMPGNGGEPLLFALEWARKENERPCSKYYHKLDVDKVAVSGQSCGGLMAIQAATDPKITTVFVYNSGLFTRDRAIYEALHAPMAIFDGGEDDIAYANGLADFNAIDNVPILFANPTSCSSNAHVCTFFEPSAGEFGRAGVAWMRWHLLDDAGPTGKGMFIGDGCGLCGPEWTLQWKNAPM